MKKVYLISGLGSDERAFRGLLLNGCTISHIRWITPLRKEPLHEYCRRLLVQIDDDVEAPILVGLSFGGLVAIEIAKLIKVEKVILISSVGTYLQIPPYFRLAGLLGLHRVANFSIVKHSKKLNEWLFGAKTEDDKRLLDAIITDTDLVFAKWALCCVPVWSNLETLSGVYHIHGTKDKIFPYRFVKATHSIEGGSHMMVVTRAEEVNRCINDILAC